LAFAAGRGFLTEALQHTRLPLGQGYAGRAALGRRIEHVADLRGRKTDFLRSPTFSQEGFISYYAVPLIAKGEIKGVLEVFHRSAFQADRDWLSFLESLAGVMAIGIDNATLFRDLQVSNTELSMAYDATIEVWSRAMDLRDRETEGHTLRVAKLTLQLARKLQVHESQMTHIWRGALLHDMGKLGVPDAVLFKPGPLTPEEWGIMRQHPTHAYEMLAPVAYLKRALDIPYCHHEKWDGTGYPRGLSGEQIPLGARIFAVADVWEALNADRPHRPAWTRAAALAYMRAQSGVHFDPRVLDTFLSLGPE
jgi:putative nucleotidyltransferase with HDIG domain